MEAAVDSVSADSGANVDRIFNAFALLDSQQTPADAAAAKAIESSKQLGVVNPQRLAQDVARQSMQHPAQAAELQSAVSSQLSERDRADFEHALSAALGAVAGAEGARAAGPEGVPDLRYINPDQAAHAATTQANRPSIRDNLEYGGLILRDPARGNFYASRPTSGTDQTFSLAKVPVPPKAEVAGNYHTHGDYSVAGPNGEAVRTSNPALDHFNSDNFSSGDIRVYNALAARALAAGKPVYKGYLGTPSGTLRQYDPATATDTTLRAPATGEFAMNAGATAGASARGGLVGAGASAAISTAQALWSGHFGADEAKHIAAETARGGGGGAAFAVAERAAANQINNFTGNAVERVATSIGSKVGAADAGALGAATRTVATRLGGAGVAGAVISAGFSAYENREGLIHGNSKAIGRVAGDTVVGAGAALAGATAGAMAGAAAGAAFGSVIPVAGTVVGAVVGLGVGFAADYVMRSGGVDKAVANVVSGGVDAAKAAAHKVASWLGF